MALNKTIYSLNVEDIQDVAMDLLNRKLTKREILVVQEEIEKHIPWYEIIENAISSKIEVPDEQC